MSVIRVWPVTRIKGNRWVWTDGTAKASGSGPEALEHFSNLHPGKLIDVQPPQKENKDV